MAVECIKHRVEFIIGAGLDNNPGRTDFKADAIPKQLGYRSHEHGGRDRDA